MSAIPVTALKKKKKWGRGEEKKKKRVVNASTKRLGG